jgi:hypothetical protein
VLVNISAMIGQAQYFLSALNMGWPVAVGVSIAMESVAIYLAAAAHYSLLSGQSSALLRLSSYGAAILSAGLNMSHYMATSTACGITFASLSLVSPWLWSTHSRARHRAQLAALGLVDQRGVKLSLNRKFWAPYRSLLVMRHAAWSGQIDPRRAVAEWESSRGAAEPARPPAVQVQRVATAGAVVTPPARPELGPASPAIRRPARLAPARIAAGAAPAGRPIKPRPLAARAIPAPSSTTGQSPYYAELAAAGTDARRARIARKITGSSSPTAVAGWLAEQGWPATVTAVRSGLRRDDGPSTGPLPRIGSVSRERAS